MSLPPIQILGHLQVKAVNPKNSFVYSEYTNEKDWQEFFTQNFPRARMPKVAFSTRKVIVIKSLGEWNHGIGLTKYEKIDELELMITIAKISLRTDPFHQITLYETYLFLSIDQPLQAVIQEGQGSNRLSEYKRLREEALISLEAHINAEEVFKELPLNTDPSSQKYQEIYSSYLNAKTKALHLNRQVINTRKALRLELSGPLLSKSNF